MGTVIETAAFNTGTGIMVYRGLQRMSTDEPTEVSVPHNRLPLPLAWSSTPPIPTPNPQLPS